MTFIPHLFREPILNFRLGGFSSRIQQLEIRLDELSWFHSCSTQKIEFLTMFVIKNIQQGMSLEASTKVPVNDVTFHTFRLLLLVADVGSKVFSGTKFV